MKRTPILTIWMVSFILTVSAVDSMNIVFWLAFLAFACSSTYISKKSKRLEKEEN